MMRFRTSILFLLMVIIILVITIFMLYEQNIHYRSQNRELIVKNDSILSVNIEILEMKRVNEAKALLKNE